MCTRRLASSVLVGCTPPSRPGLRDGWRHRAQRLTSAAAPHCSPCSSVSPLTLSTRMVAPRPAVWHKFSSSKLRRPSCLLGTALCFPYNSRFRISLHCFSLAHRKPHLHDSRPAIRRWPPHCSVKNCMCTAPPQISVARCSVLIAPRSQTPI